MSTPFERTVQGMVASARSARDGVVNTLDAVERQTRAARERLAGSPLEIRSSASQDRDDRFDPEDDAGTSLRSDGRPSAAFRTAPTSQRANGVTPTRGPAREDEDDEYPETWLR